ncbi:CPBP family intramembrane metalloprotease [Loktanella sp. IMCC34160]|uniref:CPBP family intramembrane glutamic endopeptidase n=1 Tax=Loktanella sp. IMCC34160 TaxID=2510646 RepID=UPI00101D2BE8|nr:CPBP family intramembrane glutamic endopeptidase [Loktanella sp. IMCC34160]RYG91860.1 CPBP family intramembrane metalloprotease [Loktanella sp. IMCC34160]
MTTNHGSGLSRIILFYAIAFGFSWAFWGPAALLAQGVITLPDAARGFLSGSTPAAWGPLIAALVVTWAYQGSAGLRSLLSRLVRLRFSAAWYLVALGLLPAIIGLAGLVATALGDAPPPSPALDAPATLPFAFLWIFFLGGPLQEEAGWRGIAAAGLSPRLGALGASLLTGVLWGLWHLPLFYIPTEDIYYNRPMFGLMGSTALLSVLIYWVYLNTGRSLFAAMLMHTSFNFANYLFTTLETDTGGLVYFILMGATVAVVAVGFGPRTLCRADQSRES